VWEGEGEENVIKDYIISYRKKYSSNNASKETA